MRLDCLKVRLVIFPRFLFSRFLSFFFFSYFYPSLVTIIFGMGRREGKGVKGRERRWREGKRGRESKSCRKGGIMGGGGGVRGEREREN